MKTSDNGIALIKSFEGCRLTAYQCPAGVWTIGYGHTAGVKKGQVITQEQAEAFLKDDLAKYEKYVINTGIILNQNQFDALVSFTYNCGSGNLKTLVKGRTLAEIADALLLYNKSNGKTLSGLTRRRTAERELFLQTAQETAKPEHTENMGGTYYEVPKFTLIESLDKIGVDSSYKNRKRIAAANGIENYSGTAEQNIEMLKMLNAGKLKAV